MERPHLRPLTSLRFVAAAMIVLGHARGRVGVPADWGEPFGLFFGVPFFFVLSGFILAYVYPALDAAGTRRYLVARLARLWPVHASTWCVVVVAISTGHWYANPGNTPATALANLAMVHAWVPSVRSYFSFNEPSWSISTELFFYLTFPLLIRTWRRAWGVWLVVSLALFTGLMRFAALDLPTSWLGQAGADFTGITVNPLANVYLFVLGISSHQVYAWLSPRLRIGAILGTLSELIALGLTAWTIYLPIALPELAANALANPASAVAGWVPPIPLACLIFPLLIIAMALQRGLVSRVLAWAPCVLLGEISYALYLVHLPILTVLTVSGPRLPAVSDGLALTLFWLCTLGASWALWQWVEKPARGYLRRGWVRREHTLSDGQWRAVGATLAATIVVILAIHVAILR